MPKVRTPNIVRGRNIGRGGVQTTVGGVRELAKQINQFPNAVVSRAAYDVCGVAGRIGANAIRANMRTQKWPHEAFDDVFTYDKPPIGRKRIAALVGITKRRGKAYVEWARKTRGMSLATLFEFGGSRGKDAPWYRPAFRPAIAQTKERMLQTVSSGFQQIIDSVVKSG